MAGDEVIAAWRRELADKSSEEIKADLAVNRYMDWKATIARDELEERSEKRREEGEVAALKSEVAALKLENAGLRQPRTPANLNPISHRLFTWRRIVVRPLSLIYGVLGLLGTVALLRDEFLLPEWRDYLRVIEWLPTWPWWLWAIVGLVGLLFITLESAYLTVAEVEAELPGGPGRAAIGARLTELLEAGRDLRRSILQSTDVVSAEEGQRRYDEWRVEMLNYTRDSISPAKASYVDAIQMVPVPAADINSIPSRKTHERKVNVLQHLDARLERLATIMREY